LGHLAVFTATFFNCPNQRFNSYIKINPDPRELKRALVVKMVLEGYKHREIIKICQVNSGFISKWKQEFILNGIEGLNASMGISAKTLE
jgi:transposase